MISERRFGVEIECGHRWDAYEVAQDLNREFGLDIEGDYDGSGCELRFGPVQGQDGLNLFGRVLERIRATGGYVTRSDGMHVHHEALDYIGKPDMQARLVRSWLNLEPAIGQIVAPYRRSPTFGSAPKVWKKGDGRTEVIKSRSDSYWSRGNLNLNNILHRYERRIVEEDGVRYCRYCEDIPEYCECNEIPPTVEIRWHEGSLNADAAIAWIQMGQALLDKVAQEGMTLRSCNTPRTLVKRLDLEPETGLVLVKKARTIEDPEHDRDGW